MLVITDPEKAAIQNEELILSGFAQVLFDWQEGSDPTGRAKVFKYGDIKFVPAAPPVAAPSTPKEREMTNFA